MKQKKLSPSSTAYQLVVYGNVVLYSICWMAQVPVLPYLVEKLGAKGTTQYGTLQTLFSTVQFIGGLVSGPIMDRYGGRFLLVVSFAASVACYALTACASSVWLLYLSRLPTVLQHAVLASRAIVTQLSTDADRARVLSYVAVSYSVGFTVGPAVGGLLSAVSLQFAAWMATLGSAISLVTVLLLLPDLPPPVNQPEQHQGDEEKRDEAPDGPSRAAGGPRAMLLQFVEVVKRPGVSDILIGKLLIGLGTAVYQSMFPILLRDLYGLQARENGLVMSYVGVLLLTSQAFIVAPVIAAFGEPVTEYGCVITMLVSYGALPAARSLWQLCALMVPLSVAGTLYTNASTSRLTKATLPQQRGTALAMDMSLFSGVRMLTPSIGAAVVDQLGDWAVPALTAAMIGCFLLAVQVGILNIPISPTGGGGRGKRVGIEAAGEAAGEGDGEVQGSSSNEGGPSRSEWWGRFWLRSIGKGQGGPGAGARSSPSGKGAAWHAGGKQE